MQQYGAIRLNHHMLPLILSIMFYLITSRNTQSRNMTFEFCSDDINLLPLPPLCLTSKVPDCRHSVAFFPFESKNMRCIILFVHQSHNLYQTLSFVVSSVKTSLPHLSGYGENKNGTLPWSHNHFSFLLPMTELVPHYQKFAVSMNWSAHDQKNNHNASIQSPI